MTIEYSLAERKQLSFRSYRLYGPHDLSHTSQPGRAAGLTTSKRLGTLYGDIRGHLSHSGSNVGYFLLKEESKFRSLTHQLSNIKLIANLFHRLEWQYFY